MSSNTEIDLNTIECPVCNNTYDIFDFFPHLYTVHPELLATWAGVVFPSLNPNNEEDLNHMFLNLNITEETLHQYYQSNQDNIYNSNVNIYTQILTQANEMNQELLFTDNQILENVQHIYINPYNHTQQLNQEQVNIIDNTDILDRMTYEQLSELCERIGNHKVGVNNIDKCVPATVRMKKTMREEVKCPICLDNVLSALYVRQVNKCRHEFCGPCIEKWLKENKTCPICKVNVEEIESNEISSENTNTIMQSIFNIH